MIKKKLDIYINTLPKKVIFCKKCVVSNQRPRITFDNQGICSACRYFELKKNVINWKERENELKKLVLKIKKNSKKNDWNVLVPGSGGKDSAYVAHILKEKYGLNPLCVTWSPNIYTDIGFENFSSFTDSGFLTMNCFPNGVLNRALTRLGFEEIGDNFVPFTMGQHGFVYHIAEKFKINAVFFGEGAELEYGGDTKAYNRQGSHSLSDNAERYWKGNTIRKLVEYGKKNKKYFKNFNEKSPDLNFYEPPKKIRKNIKMYYMNYFVNWKPQENYYYASEHTNFKPNKIRSDGTYSKYASLDDKLDGLHFYMMLIKFGFGRTTSDAAHEIRDELITREDGINLVEEYDQEFPKNHFRESLDYMGIKEADFEKTVNSFRPKHIWKKVRGQWKLRHTVGLNGTDD